MLTFRGASTFGGGGVKFSCALYRIHKNYNVANAEFFILVLVSSYHFEASLT